MSTKSKARAARRTNPEDVIVGELMEALLNAITFGALESDNDTDSETETAAA
jgi:hypothetical protein